MSFRSVGIVALSLFMFGCATVSDEATCEESCELQVVCEDVEECSPVLVELGTTEVCQVQTVSVDQEFCNTYQDTITTCSGSEVSQLVTVTGTAQVSHTETTCTTSSVTSTDTVSLTGPATHTELSCEDSESSHTDSVCGTGTYSYTETECEDDSVTHTGEVCDTNVVSTHRLLNFETAADGSSIPVGAWGDEVALAYVDWGVEISVTKYNGSASSTGLATFGSLSPTGNDWDLGTGNNSWGGPGSGSGGYSTNFFERGNLLIHAEDLGDTNSDGLLDDPDDEASGAKFHFDFDTTVCIQSLTLIDIESSENGYLRMYDMVGAEIFSQKIVGLGDNSIQIVDPNLCGVQELVFEMCGSGALDDLRFTQESSVETCLDYEEECSESTCTDTRVTDTLEVCTDHTFTCTDTECEEVTVTQDVTLNGTHTYTCEQGSCSESLVTQTVTTQTPYEYACMDITCQDIVVDVPVCGIHTVSQEVEVCIDVPNFVASESCETIESCDEEMVCDDSNCDPESEWLSGGGFPGSK